MKFRRALNSFSEVDNSVDDCNFDGHIKGPLFIATNIAESDLLFDKWQAELASLRNKTN